MNVQHWIHWLDEGKGGRIVSFFAVVLFIIFFSVFVGYKQFGGPADEQVFRDALVARNVAEGKGYVTSVNYPYVAAYFEGHDAHAFDLEKEYPELFAAPMYPLLLAGAIKVLPASFKNTLFQEPDFSGYFRADFFLLGVNLFLFWIVCGLTWALARRLFSTSVSWLALGGLFFSYGIWNEVLAVTGVTLSMVWLLLLFHVLTSWERYRRSLLEADGSIALGRGLGMSALIGLLVAAFFLTDYSSVLFLWIVLGYFVWLTPGKLRWLAPLVTVSVFILSVSPWALRNIELTGSPLGLSGHDAFLRAGDPTAEPTIIKNTWDTELPAVSIPKMVNKGLQGIRVTVSEKLWSSGSMFLGAFFLCGVFYRFRKKEVDTVRWLAVVTVVVVLLMHPFVTNGDSIRSPNAYLVPLMLIFGAGFLAVLWESTGDRPVWKKSLAFVAVIALQALPLARTVLEPVKQTYFSFPPYLPRVMYLIGPGVADRLKPDYGLMCDVPAGFAWYSGRRVWAQPHDYLDFATIMKTQRIGGLLLSPQVLDKPYFSQLSLSSRGDAENKSSISPSWQHVYEGVARKELPLFFPLQNHIRILDNVLVLIDDSAKRAR